jgi:hypothetical protein
MRKSFAFLAVIVFAGLVTDAALAATCKSERSTCLQGAFCLSDNRVYQTACRNRCAIEYSTCVKYVQWGMRPAKLVTTPPKSGASTINNPPAVPLRRSKSGASGITNVQAVPLNQTNQQYVRPGPNGNPCTVHCGSLGGRKGR